MRRLRASALAVALTACGGSTIDLGDPTRPAGDAGSATTADAAQVSNPPRIEVVVQDQALPGPLGVAAGHLVFKADQWYRFDVATRRRATLGASSYGPPGSRVVMDGRGMFFFGPEGDSGQGTRVVGSEVPGCSFEECDGWTPQVTARVPGSVVATAVDATDVFAVTRLAGPDWHHAVVRASRSLAQRGGSPNEAPVTTVTDWYDDDPSGLVAQGDQLYLVLSSGVYLLDKGTGRRQLVVAREVAGGDAIAADASFLYVMWGASATQTKIAKVARAGGAPETMAELDQPAYGAVRMVASGAKALFVATSSAASDGRLLRIDKVTHAITDVATGLGQLGGLVVSDGYVYWSNTTRGTIVRVADY